MNAAPISRAVVFALEDLPASDRQHILDLAVHLNLPVDPLCWRAPLVLTQDGPAPLLQGLRSDAELAAQGPSLLLLAMRLLLADAYHWPEQSWLHGDDVTGSEGCALYAAEPSLWTQEALVCRLGQDMPVRRGLVPHDKRPPMTGGDRVPVLGWQVPVLGRKDPVAQVRDLRPPEQQQHRFGGVTVPLGMVPGNRTDRHRVFFQVRGAEPAHEGLRGTALLDVLLVDGTLGETMGGTLILTLSLTDPGGAQEDPEVLCDLLREVLPSSLLVTPAGQLVLFDLFRLGLVAHCAQGKSPLSLRQVHMAPPGGPDSARTADEGTELLDSLLWEPQLLSSLVLPEETHVSRSGRFVTLHLSGLRDGVPLDGFLVLDTMAEDGARAVAWPLDLDGPAPSLALSPDEDLLAVCRSGGLPALSPACIDADVADDLLLLALPAPGKAAPLHLLSSVSLPAAMRAPAPPQLFFLPGQTALVCAQAAGRLLCTVDGGRIRPTTAEDLLCLLQVEGGIPLRRLLRAAAAKAGDGREDVPALSFLEMGGPEDPEGLRHGAIPPAQAQALLREPVPQAAAAVLAHFLAGVRPHTLGAAVGQDCASVLVPVGNPCQNLSSWTTCQP